MIAIIGRQKFSAVPGTLIIISVGVLGTNIQLLRLKLRSLG
jgi:hypothetical protein